MLKAIIMDFDGLIVDTDVVLYHLYVDWFKTHKCYDLSVQEYLSCVGSDYKSLFHLLDSKGIHVDCEAFVRETTPRFISESKNLPARPGVESFLRNCKKNGLLVALATSAGLKKPVDFLGRLGLIKYFDLLVTAQDVKRIKPYPDLFLVAAEKLRLKPAECLVVEDSQNGLLAGKNANMRVLIVPNDVTRFSDFEGRYLLYSSLGDVDVPSLISEF